MHFSLPLLALLPLASALSQQQQELVVRDFNVVSHLEKRAAAASSSYLASIFGLVTSDCAKACSMATEDFTACAALPSQASIAACACSAQAIGDVRTCAACISADKKTSKSDSLSVVEDYNSYVDLCTSEGLVSVTGTVKVGASTSSLPRSTIASSIPSTTQRTSAIPSASVSRATYDPNASFTGSVAGVPSLVASGVSVSTAAGGRQAAASTGASASASATPASGEGRVVVGGLAAVVLGAVGLVL